MGRLRMSKSWELLTPYIDSGVTFSSLKTDEDIADLQYHPYPDSKFANKFEEAFIGMKCTSRNYVPNIDDKLSKFEIAKEEDDLNEIDIMPPPIFSRTTISQSYKSPLTLTTTDSPATNKTPA